MLLCGSERFGCVGSRMVSRVMVRRSLGGCDRNITAALSCDG